MKMKVYLAGPDVFRKNALSYFDKVKKVLVDEGHIPLSPLDNEVDLKSDNASLEIYLGNIDMIHECDVVFANLTLFRGPNVDDGTAFEIGYAKALGKLIYGYTYDCYQQFKTAIARHNPRIYLSEFSVMEDFGHCRNLMIHHSIIDSGGKILPSLTHCLQELHII